MCMNNLNIDRDHANGMVIIRCHRLGKKDTSGTYKRPIIVCFLNFQLGPRYEGQLNPMAEPIPHEVRPLVRTHVYHPYHAADRRAGTDSRVLTDADAFSHRF